MKSTTTKTKKSPVSILIACFPCKFSYINLPSQFHCRKDKPKIIPCEEREIPIGIPFIKEAKLETLEEIKDREHGEYFSFKFDLSEICIYNPFLVESVRSKSVIENKDVVVRLEKTSGWARKVMTQTPVRKVNMRINYRHLN